MSEFRDTFNQRPLDPKVLESAAGIMLGQKHYAGAYHLLRSAIDSPTLTLRLQFGLSQVLLAGTTGEPVWRDRGRQVLAAAARDFPDSAEALKCYGMVLVEDGNFEDAEPILSVALGKDQEQADAWVSLAWCRFVAGDWAGGWDAHERFLVDRYTTAAKYFHNLEYWDGIPIDENECIRAIGKGGVGDEIMFASMLPDVPHQLYVECDPRLVRLFQRSFPKAYVTHRKDPYGREIAFLDDGAIPRSVPSPTSGCFTSTFGRDLRRSAESFPRTPYLVPDPEKVAYWRERLSALPGKKVGIAWAGGPVHDWHRRTLHLEDLVQLLDVPGVSWVSLEYLTATESIQQLAARGITVHEFPEAVLAGVDFDETAALVTALDGVVTMQTAMAHLCGGLGKRAHVLLPRIPRWWHGMSGRDHPWYGSLVLHRQVGEWPLEEVRRELIEDLTR